MALFLPNWSRHPSLFDEELEVTRMGIPNMAQKVMVPTKRKMELTSAAGLSMVELLVVVSLVAVLSSVAVVSFSKSNRNIKVNGASRLLSGYLEKARLDSLRRHGGATVVFNSTSGYTVNLDWAGTGTTTSRAITLPTNITVRYSLPPSTTIVNPSTTPVTVAYNWRGQATSTVLVTLTDSSSGASSTLVVGSAGDISSGTTVTGPVTNPTPLNSTVTTTTAIKSMSY